MLLNTEEKTIVRNCQDTKGREEVQCCPLLVY